ncbi:MAG TPA: hypothetical protein DCG14_03245, partial [Phycisphaerales bacterium]|nr:hypothetical protein [Phycisphaerales bacterium]
MNSATTSNPPRLAGLRVLLYAMLSLVALTAFLPIIYMVGFSTGLPDPSASFGTGGGGEAGGRAAGHHQ